MSSTHSRRQTRRLLATAAVLTAGSLLPSGARAQRVTGIDISDWQGSLSQATWNTVKAQGRSFAFIRSSRGGTTGFYDETDAANDKYGQNTQGQRYDDLYFINNITRATNAGLYAGPYHFARPDVTTYVNDYGITVSQTGADEANHFLQMAGPWMKPGYLLPVDDLEAGASQRSTASLSAFHVEFANTILSAKGVRPIVYVNQSYAVSEVNTTVAAAMPNNWVARWPNQSNPELIDIQNIDPPPSPSTANVYGSWYPAGQPYPTPQPWKFWQYGSNNTNVAGISPVDVDVAHGDIEFLKDYLVPAMLTTDANANWSTVGNWNSDADPSGLGPAARLPSIDDTVILDRGAANPTMTLSSGTHSIRKLFVSETLNMTGGSLSVGYVPYTPRAIDFGAGPISAQFSSAVTLAGSASLSVHTLQIDANASLTSTGGGVVEFNSILLAPSSSATPGKVILAGDISINPMAGATASIASASGSGTSGSVDLAGGSRTILLSDGAATTDLLISVPVTNGSLTKSGLGQLGLTNTNTFAGPLTVKQGNVALFGASGTVASASGYVLHPAGTLTLDNLSGGNNNNRVGNSAQITLAGGTLWFLANSTTESAGPLAATQGASTVSLSGAAGGTLAFGTYARSPGASVNFTGVSPTLKATFVGQSLGAFVDQGTFVNGVDYAVYDAAGYVRAMAVGPGASDYATTLAAGRHVKLSSAAVTPGPLTLATLHLAGSGVDVTLAAASDLNVAGVIKSGGGTATIAAPAGGSLVTDPGIEFVVNTAAAGDSLTIAAPVAVNAGLTKTGPGTLTLTNPSNNFGGTLTVAQGLVRAAAAGAIHPATSARIGSGATLDLTASQTLTAVTMHDGALTGSANSPTLTLNGANPTVTYDGVATGGTISVPAITLGTSSGSATFNVADSYTLSDLLVSSVLQNNPADPFSIQGLTKSGPGTLVLSGNNTFNGPLAVTGGTLSVPVIQPSSTTPQPLGTGGGNITLSSNSTFQYTGAATATMNRGIALGAGGGTIHATVGTFQNAFSLQGNGNPLTLLADDGAISLTGTITGTGTSVIKNGTGSATLGGTSLVNAYTGNTFINAGTLNYSHTNNLGSLSNSIVFSGGTLRMIGAVGTEGRAVSLSSGGGTIDTNGFATTFAGVFSGSGGLTKVGNATLALSAANTYTGQTLVSGGTLAVNGSLAAGSSVRVIGGGQLGGSGAVNGPVTITTGGIVNLSANGTLASLNVVGPTGGTWSGSGVVNGPVTVGSGTLTVSSTMTAPGGVQVIGGTLAGGGTVAGNVTAGSTVTSTGRINFSSAGSIGGTLTIASDTEWNGQGSVAGTTTVGPGSSRTLYVNGTLGGAGGLVLSSGTNLKGLGTVAKTITFSGNNRLGGHSRLYKAVGGTDPDLGTLTITTPVNWNQANLFINAGRVSTPGDTLSGSLTIQAAPIVEHVTIPGLFTDPYHGRLVGGGTLTITSSGLLAGQGEVTKPVVLQGGTINFSSAGTLGPIGDIASTMTVTSGTWAGIGSVTGLITVAGPGNFQINSGATLTAPSGVTVSGGTISAGGSTSTLAGSLTYGSTTPSTFAGRIVGAGKTLTVNNGGSLTLTGSSTYTGLTTVADGILTLTANNQIPSTAGIITGMVVVTGGTGGSGHGGTLQLSNGLSYALPLTIGGAGVSGVSLTAPGSLGALHATSGTNTWSGPITLAGTGANGTDPLINQVSAAAGATLTISGAISSGGAGSLAKSGAGDLVLSGASANAYSGLTRLYGGRMIVEKDGALGTAANHTFVLPNSSSTIAFRSATGLTYATQEIIHTDGGGNGLSGQVDNFSGNNTFAGSIAFGGPTMAGEITSSVGVTLGSLTIGGGWYARTGFANTTRTINKIGAGTLILTGDSSLAPASTSATALAGSTLNVNAGTLELRSPVSTAANVEGITAYNVATGTSLVNTAGTLAGAALAVAGSYSQTAARLQGVAMTVSGNGLATLQPSASAASVLSSLMMSGTGRLNITSNRLIVDYSGLTPADTIRQYLFDDGLFSSTADADPQSRVAVAYVEASALLGLSGADTATWGGAVVDGSSLLIKSTWLGDADFSGTVTATDYTLIDRGYAMNLVGWQNGDFNHDGVVNVLDYGLIDRVFFQQSGAYPSPEFLAAREAQFGAEYAAQLYASVPEPTATGVLVACLPLVVRRRRPA